MSDEGTGDSQMVPKTRLDAQAAKLREAMGEIEALKAETQKALAAATGWKNNHDELEAKRTGEVEEAITAATAAQRATFDLENSVRDAMPGAPAAIRRLILADHGDMDSPPEIAAHLAELQKSPPDYLAPFLATEAGGGDGDGAGAAGGEPPPATPPPKPTPGNTGTKPPPKTGHPWTVEQIKGASLEEYGKHEAALLDEVKL